MKVSIIIPCYNSEIYIEKCLNSVVHQTYREKEIICVDDGSTDHTLEILRKYEAMFDCIKVLNLTHKGIVSAKQEGFVSASGDYIIFIDSDDWLENEMIQSLIDIIENTKVDGVCYGYKLVKGVTESNCYPSLDEGKYDNKTICQKLYNIKLSNKIFNWAQWSYILKRDLLEGIMSKIDKRLEIYEDLVFTWTSLITAKSIYVCHNIYYFYRVHQDSTGRKKNDHSLEYISYAYNNLKKIIKGHCCESVIIKQLNYMMYDAVQMNTCFSDERQDFYMFPYEMVPQNSKIVLYGAGYVGKSYFRQIKVNRYCEILKWVDVNYESMVSGKYMIDSPDVLNTIKCEYVLISNIHKEIADVIKVNMHDKYGIPYEKIITCDAKKLSCFADF